MYLDLKKILIDENLYPRNVTFWKYTQLLMGAMRTGSTLPPIIVGKRDGRFVIIDGRHRYEAHVRLKKPKIAAIVTTLKESEWFAEAVRLNTTHGHGLSYQEKIIASMILQRANYTPEQISQIVHIPVDKLLEAITQRGTWVKPEDIKPIVAKAPFAEEAKRKGRTWFEQAAAQGLDEEQENFSGSSFKRLANEVLILLGDEHLNSEDESIVELVSKLQKASTIWLEEHAKTSSAA